MKGILLISHGPLAEGMLKTAEIFFGENIPQMKAVVLNTQDDPEDFRGRLQEAVKEVDTGEGVLVFAFCFAVTLGVFWEIYEFTFDGILRLNMQKFMLENGTQLIGRAALLDTMKDLIVDCLGAFIMSFVGYLSLRYKTGFIEKLQLKWRKGAIKDNKTA